jgi:hypothetical protein
MTHLINLATGKLNDPILMDWALDRYRQASEGRSPRLESMEGAMLPVRVAAAKSTKSAASQNTDRDCRK